MHIKLIVPTDAMPQQCPPVKQYGPAIARIAGGFTATQATGGWMDNQGQLIVEPVTVFDCTVDDDCQLSGPFGRARDFEDLARQIAHELHQKCVYLEIDGEVEYVTC